ncbi:ABC transporter ATP-binding protein [Bdellovibrio sp. GT3]|uniref:ABC transporter ATP-binding protein n=1 Tax=Bdellovibrio sp. GT3 TaxID=3136282 RepID=UPI0030F219F7
MKTGFELVSLSVKYPFQKVWALKDVSLTISPGTFTVVLGANGSGKSTLIKCLAGSQRWTQGTLSLDGRSRAVDNTNFNAQQILVSEDIILPDFTIARLVHTYQKIWTDFDQSTFERIMKYSNLARDKTPKELSRGQRVLLQFGLALGTQVPIILVDEVTATLDPFVRRKVVEELDQHARRSGTVVMATNIASETQHVNSQLVLINNGIVFKTGEHHQIRQQFVKKYFENSKVDNMNPLWVEVSRDDEGIFAVTERESKEGGDSALVTLEEMFTYLVEKAKR